MICKGGEIITNLHKLKNENEEQYLWRIGQAVDSGDIESWSSINSIINKEILGDDEEHYRTESAWRKRYQSAKKFYNQVFSKMEPSEYQEKLNTLNRELQRNTVKFRDERRSWNKQNYEDARFEEVMELLESELPKIANINFPIHEIPNISGETELLCCLSDLHIGQTFESLWGKYNSDIARERLDEYLEEVIKIGNLHKASKIHIASLGDQISGCIHHTIQISNKENVVVQVQIAIEYITSFCYELTKYFKDVYFYDVSGNHSRLNPNKDKSVKDERLDNLIGWTVCKLLEHIPNFHSMTHRKLDSTIGDANILGKTYLLLHGDMDTINKTGIGNLVTMIGFCPDYCICGHKHTPAMAEFNGIGVYQSGSIAGSGDDYTVQGRMSGNPSQTVLVCDSCGVRCCYNVTLYY